MDEINSAVVGIDDVNQYTDKILSLLMRAASSSKACRTQH